MTARPVIAVITDEVSQDIGAVLEFAVAHRVERVDIRAVDVANQVSAGHPPPTPGTVAAVARLGGTVHVKDLDANGRYVPVGQGMIDQLLAIALETHMPDDGWQATATALFAVRDMLGICGSPRA